mmetsp:Transcript_43243/g.99682  ORF Transcript_43243/g.99682 Transcript_43243/m.99682 type:complete len:276 (-) Transcript_43243:96-923(-)
MGIPDSEFLDPDGIVDTLRCPICTEVFLDPLECKQCQMAFCKQCFEKSFRTKAQCPQCRCPSVMESLVPAHRRTRTDLNALKVRCMREGCSWTGRFDARAGHECVVAKLDALKLELANKSMRVVELDEQVQLLQAQVQNQKRQIEELHREKQQDKLLLADVADEAHGRHQKLQEYLQHGSRPQSHPCIPSQFLPTWGPWPRPTASNSSAWPGGLAPPAQPTMAPMPGGSLQMMPASTLDGSDNSNQCPAPVPVMFYYCNMGVPLVPSQYGSAEEP